MSKCLITSCIENLIKRCKINYQIFCKKIVFQGPMEGNLLKVQDVDQTELLGDF